MHAIQFLALRLALRRKQFGGLLTKEGIGRAEQPLDPVQLRCLLLVGGPLFGNRLKQLELPPHPDQALMGLAELREVIQQTLDLFSPGRGLKHVVSDETVQALDVLDGHGLVEHAHRLGPHSRLLDEPPMILGIGRGSSKTSPLHLLLHPLRGCQACKIGCYRAFVLREAVEFLGSAFGIEIKECRK